MERFIKIPISEQMKKDYNECASMTDDGEEKDCSSCSFNGGEAFGCIGEYSWCKGNQNLMKGEEMRLTIVVDVDIEESGLDQDEVKDNIINFTKDLLIIGAAEQEIGISLKEVRYS